jgi:hypothetical protein
MAVDRLLAHGVVFGCCDVALKFQSKMLAGNAGVSAAEAAKEWAANVILPSGGWGVNRARRPAAPIAPAADGRTLRMRN